jgi:GTP 3',8-cyclase
METPVIDYLRLSLTDRCNLNCIYCTPLEKSKFLERHELLTHEERARAAGAFVAAGIRKIRLTGGEPLIKRNVVGLIGMIGAIPGLEELALTTNGICLEEMSAGLKEAGLDLVNISVDSLKKERFKAITGYDGFETVWRGIQKALGTGFKKVKLNVVLMKGVNDDEAADFAKLSLDYPLSVRFIELFNTNRRSGLLADALVTTAEAKKKIESKLGPLSKAAPQAGGGPAEAHKLRGARGELGFISGSSSSFCGACNRVRLDCAGRIYPCLFSAATHDLRPLLRSGAPAEELAAYIRSAFLVKYDHNKSTGPGHIEMSSIGG